MLTNEPLSAIPHCSDPVALPKDRLEGLLILGPRQHLLKVTRVFLVGKPLAIHRKCSIGVLPDPAVELDVRDRQSGVAFGGEFVKSVYNLLDFTHIEGPGLLIKPLQILGWG